MPVPPSAAIIQSTVVASDGAKLAVRDWPLTPGCRVRGLVLLVHGLGEHVGRYEKLARWLNEQGFAVRGYDQYGHGESDGPRGGLPTENRLLDDLATMVERSRASCAPGTPLILLGHSLGGLVAAKLVATAGASVNALVLSSPALDPGLNLLQKVLLAVVPKIAPDLRVGNGLNASLLSHDPAVVSAYKNDKRVHDRISGRLARFIAQEGAAVLACAPAWIVPTLLLYAGADRLVNPAACRAFADNAPSSVVNARCFDTLYHEIFNELEAGPVFAELQHWLERLH